MPNSFDQNKSAIGQKPVWMEKKKSLNLSGTK